jgi:uncharacterized protein YjbI with pentapeptide repeats
MKYDILNRWTGKVQFTADIDCPESAVHSVKVGLAVLWAFKTGASLDGARLDGANLDGASLIDASLIDASLIDASIIGASLDGARLDRARLDGANLIDANLDGANLVGARLDGARLDGANLVGARLDRARLDGANLDGANLVDASLIDANLDGANLVGARLIGVNLDKANLGAGVPVIPDVHRVVYEAASVPGALDMEQWHCGTAHCRAGWIVTLAGEAGMHLEERMGTAAAAAAIYLASDPHIGRMPDFYASNDEALADMQARARDGVQSITQ